jgi:hypothetical protein
MEANCSRENVTLADGLRGTGGCWFGPTVRPRTAANGNDFKVRVFGQWSVRVPDRPRLGSLSARCAWHSLIHLRYDGLQFRWMSRVGVRRLARLDL